MNQPAVSDFRKNTVENVKPGAADVMWLAGCSQNISTAAAQISVKFGKNNHDTQRMNLYLTGNPTTLQKHIHGPQGMLLLLHTRFKKKKLHHHLEEDFLGIMALLEGIIMFFNVFCDDTIPF